jgi:hypothetical protein
MVFGAHFRFVSVSMVQGVRRVVLYSPAVRSDSEQSVLANVHRNRRMR